MAKVLTWSSAKKCMVEAVGGDAQKYEQDLIGDKNKTNLVYTTPDLFQPDSIRVYRMGVRANRGSSDDYIISESGGLGTGYDTITFNDRPPEAGTELFADYILA